MSIVSIKPKSVVFVWYESYIRQNPVRYVLRGGNHLEQWGDVRTTVQSQRQQNTNGRNKRKSVYTS